MMMLWRVQSSLTKIRGYFNVSGHESETRELSSVKRGRNEVECKDMATTQSSCFYLGSSYNHNCNFNCSNSPRHYTKYKMSSKCSVTTSKTTEIPIKNENNNSEVVEPATPRIVDRIPCQIRSYHHHRNSSITLLEDMNLDCVNSLAIEFVRDIEFEIDNKIGKKENNNNNIVEEENKTVFEKNPYPELNIPLSQYIQAHPHATFKINNNPSNRFNYNRFSSIQSSKFINKVNKALSTTFRNKNHYNTIESCSLGSGGVYFIKDESGKKNLAVFKPQDEEPRSKNNPKGFKPIINSNEGSLISKEEGLRRGSISGEGALKEQAAYLLDHDNFCGIPVTSFVELEIDNGDGDRCIKRGSLQEYVNYDYDAEECGTSAISKDQVHKICLTDIRYVNTDRNGQNILIKEKNKNEEKGVEITPIDHGYCFPEVFEDAYFEWMYWPQAKKKFNDEIKDYIMNLDVEMDIKKLKLEGIELSEESNKVFSFSTNFLKWATEKGYTPYEMAEIMCMPVLEDSEKQPKIATLYNIAKSLGGSFTTNDSIVGQISMISERVSYLVFEEHLSLGRHSI